MIDVHCHIIPEIDDGSKSVTQTFKMAEAASKLGYKGIFATPHYIKDSHETSSNDIKNSVDVLNKQFLEKGIDIKLYCGNEVYFCTDVLNLIESQKVCTLGNSKYVLIEFPMNGTALNMENVIFNILRVGYVPVIAHPERYEFVHKDIKKLLPFIEEGALLQINVASIVGFYGECAKKTVKKLLKYDMVHLIGTDSHDPSSVYDVYEKSMKKIKKVVKDDKLENILIENPRSIVEDKVIEIWSPKLKV